ncbi:MAG: ferritin-like domain-containing protein [Aquaticitalea sp.]
MSNNVLKEKNEIDVNKRRQFLKLSGMAIIGSSLLYACSSDDDSPIIQNPDLFDLGSGNLGILNYAYALEQLEAAFYTQVLSGSYWMNAPAEEKQILEDLYNHEVIHREFFRTAITDVAPNNITPDLEFDFSSVDFSSRTSVLGTSKILEDTGVAAYNGAGKLISVNDAAGMAYLTLAGKIVSVEARHASAIRDLLNPGSMDFAGDDILIGIGTDKAFDKATPPADILAAVVGTGFVVTQFTANNLPTS